MSAKPHPCHAVVAPPAPSPCLSTTTTITAATGCGLKPSTWAMRRTSSAGQSSPLLTLPGRLVRLFGLGGLERLFGAIDFRFGVRQGLLCKLQIGLGASLLCQQVEGAPG